MSMYDRSRYGTKYDLLHALCTFQQQVFSKRWRLTSAMGRWSRSPPAWPFFPACPRCQEENQHHHYMSKTDQMPHEVATFWSIRSKIPTPVTPLGKKIRRIGWTHWYFTCCKWLLNSMKPGSSFTMMESCLLRDQSLQDFRDTQPAEKGKPKGRPHPRWHGSKIDLPQVGNSHLSCIHLNLQIMHMPEMNSNDSSVTKWAQHVYQYGKTQERRVER